ncbi:25S rRNA (cytosine2870-C5)-methyltransferase [Nematocida minor]|uniref:25S rRNA (cytosine2870-C5)-methyltransferase n=1 Tax=Nematocida minor TaxID=1912983 RepID=UPI0022207B99|nr:25S rRNA (cytosine2870-C5)-methyltransferase [Nematocida minor]KAI5189157.1 25S rRNA (cytosine2870-C5)-methyltransferase [Nematocida minor]
MSNRIDTENIHPALSHDESEDAHFKAEEQEEEAEETTRLSATEATYNDYLLQKITEMFNKEEKEAFMIASDQKRPVTIRTNTLFDKRQPILQKLANRGVNIEGIEWNNCSAVVYNSDVPIGATPEYLAGLYILQSPSSVLPVLALDPQENETVVDMCAAPGGKTTHIAALMNNTGTIYANDVSEERAISLAANIQRMGVSNTIVSVMGGRGLPFTNVNRVLLDAPCSGTGVLSKDPAAKRNKDEKVIKQLQYKQMALILKAFDMLDPRTPETSILVYSTCSILVEENEYIVDHLLKKRKNARVIDAGLPIGKEGYKSYRGWTFHPSLKNTRRLYPHVHNTDGFFVAKIRKIGYSPEEIEEKKAEKIKSRDINKKAKLEKEKPAEKKSTEPIVRKKKQKDSQKKAFAERKKKRAEKAQAKE